MGSVMHPVGSAPPGAYWLRRLLMLALLLLLVAGGWWLFGRIGGAGGTPSPVGSSGPLASASTSGSSTSTTSPTPRATQTGSPGATAAAQHTSPTPSATATAACPESAIRVLAATDATSYAPGAEPHLTVQVTNTGHAACRRDLGQAALELVVSSGGKRTWSSDDCSPGGGQTVVVLRPGQTFSSTVIWDRATSRPGCPAATPAPAGSYQLVSRNLATHSAPVPFALR